MCKKVFGTPIIIRTIRTIIIITAVALLSGADCPSATPHSQANDITYGKDYNVFKRQKLSTFKSQDQINTSDLRPEISIDDTRFFYKYRFTNRTPLQDLPLQFYYQDALGSHLMAQGWRVCMDFQLDTSHQWPVLSPILPVYKSKDYWFLLEEDEEIPLKPVLQDNAPDLLTTVKSYHGNTYLFKMLDCGQQVTLLPYRIIRELGEDICFTYQFSHQTPQLQTISCGEFSLSFLYNQNRLATIRMYQEIESKKQNKKQNTILHTTNIEQSSRIIKQWQMEYHSSEDKINTFLTAITPRNTGTPLPHPPSERLEFSYAIDTPPPSLVKSAKTSAAWQLQQGNIAYMLPDSHMSIRNRPGLRIMDIDRDHHLDVLNSAYRQRPQSWLGKPGMPGYWQEFSHSYTTPVPLVKYDNSKGLMGSIYSSLAKEFIIYQYNTHKFQSIITSYYQPTPDGKQLQYTRLVYFPRIKNSLLDPDASGNCWRPDDHQLLQLPIPLQYQGKRPWPTDRPGIAAVERFGGTGAQFVDFTGDGRLNLFYIGPRYRDADTGEVLLAKKNEAWFRDTHNCVEWYETTWDHLGKTRKVKVDLCQAFWRARKRFWDERYPKQYPGKSFWQRMDLNPDGTPNSKYVLPLQTNPHLYHHYNRFRSVTFARLDKRYPKHVFALIHGRGCPACTPPVPPISKIYRLIPGLWRWRELPSDSDYYPPQHFLERYDSTLADITGDGIDDAIIAVGPTRKTYINTGIPGHRWKDSRPHYLPRQCDLSNGSCQLLNLDNDKLIDLFIGNGWQVYLNRSQSTGKSMYTGYMERFTDEKGVQKSVEDVNEKLYP